MLIYENPSCEDARWATEFLSVMPFDSRCMYGLGSATRFGYDKFNVAHRIIAISFFVKKNCLFNLMHIQCVVNFSPPPGQWRSRQHLIRSRLMNSVYFVHVFGVEYRTRRWVYLLKMRFVRRMVRSF